MDYNKIKSALKQKKMSISDLLYLSSPQVEIN